MSKGTIIYVGGFELPDKNAAAHRVLNNGKIFRDLGYDVVFIDVDKSLDNNIEFLKTIKNIQGFDCFSVSYPKNKFEWIRYLTNINFMSDILKEYKDIRLIIAYNYPSIALKRLKKYGNQNCIKVMGDCTEWYSTKGENLLFKIIKGLDTFYRMRIIQKKLDGIIVISKYLEDYYINIKNTVRIPPLVDIDEPKWSLAEQKIRENYLKKMRFIYSGSPGRNKDKIIFILNAFYELRNNIKYDLIIVGINKIEFINDYPDYEYKLEELGDSLKFLGRVSHEESLVELYNSQYSIFIREETRVSMAGFPTKFVESIICGVPVITTNTSDISHYLIEGVNGFLVNYDDENSLINLINKLGTRVDLYDKEYNRKIGAEHFDYRNYIEKFERFLRELNI